MKFLGCSSDISMMLEECDGEIAGEIRENDFNGTIFRIGPALYAKYRPGYPSAIVDIFEAGCGIECGFGRCRHRGRATGISTRLCSRPHVVDGVRSSSRMQKMARGKRSVTRPCECSPAWIGTAEATGDCREVRRLCSGRDRRSIGSNLWKPARSSGGS